MTADGCLHDGDLDGLIGHVTLFPANFLVHATTGRIRDVLDAAKITIAKGVIRGVESDGMLCSFEELDLASESDGIIELPDTAPVGAVYAQWAGLDDPVIEINLTPNRPDCRSILGMAREVAALYGTRVRRPAVELAAGGRDDVDLFCRAVTGDKGHQAAVAQVRDEIRVLHEEVDRARNAEWTNATTGFWNRRKLDTRIAELIATDRPFCLMLVRVRNLPQIAAQHP